MIVLRSMMGDADGFPAVGKSGRYLGARPTGKFRDIDVSPTGLVFPGTGGISVSPPPPENIPSIIRDRGDPIWELATEELPEELRHRPDPDPEKQDTHGFIEPSTAMSFDEYQAALHSTREMWSLY